MSAATVTAKPSKKKTKTKLPRGLWVGKLRKSPARIAEEGLSADDAECYYPRWYYRIRRRGLPTKREAMPETVTTREQAMEYGRTKLLNALTIEEANEKLQMGRMRQQLEDLKAKRWCSLGDYFAAWRHIMIRKGLQDGQQGINCLRRVVAVALGWSQAFGKVRADHDGGKLQRRVDALPVDVVSLGTRKAYMLACQVAAGGAPGGVAITGADGKPDVNWERRNPPVVNRTINSVLNKAKQLLCAKHRQDELLELLVPWDVLDKFFAGARLPEPVKDVAAELPTREQYSLMLEAWRVLHASGREEDQELALCNELLRLLGLRSGELCMARESWLVEHAGRTFLDLRNRPEEHWACKSGTRGRLPLSDELALRLRARLARAREAGVSNPFLILPMLGEGSYDAEKRRARELTARAEMVRIKHNAWLKGFIDETRSRQGNHRLRKFVATMIYWGEMKVDHNHDRAANKVKRYLRHESEATTLLHYIAPRDDFEDTVSDAALAAAWDTEPVGR